MQRTTRSIVAPLAFASFLAIGLAFCLSFTTPAHAATLTAGEVAASDVSVDTQATGYLVLAKKKFGVTNAHVIKATTPKAIANALAEAGSKATKKYPWIVYVPVGNYTMPKKLTVPANVILTAAKGAVFKPKTAKNFTQFFEVAGSVYGGTYDGANKAYYCLRFAEKNFGLKKETNNGTIQKAVTKNAQRYGIVAQGSACKNGIVLKCTATSCGASGISAVEGAHIARVSGCSVSKCAQSGVNLGHANIDVIINCKLTNNKGHGISTDINGSGGHKYCYMVSVSKNTITGNGVNGVYIDKNCKISKNFSNNTVSNNKLNGLSVSTGGLVQLMANNTFNKNGSSNLSVEGASAKAYIGNGNKFLRAGTNNVGVKDRAAVYLRGSNNSFNLATNVGISVNTSSSFTWKSGTKNVVKGNKGFGIRVEGKSACTIKNMAFGDNGGFAVKVYSGCKITQSNCGLSTKAGVKNRLYIG